MKYTYNHPRFNDKVVEECKVKFREFSERYVARTAIDHVAKAMNMNYRDVASCIATKKKPAADDMQLSFGF